MTEPLHRIRLGGVVLATVLVVAVAGYRFIGQRDWLDSLYMVVITISSVGFGEKSDLSASEKMFTVAVIVVGMSAAGYTLGGLLQLMTEGEITRTLGLRRMTNEIERLKDHVIICGFGRMGQILAEELQRQRQPLVIVDHTPEAVTEAQSQGYLAYNGDATEEETLQAVRIEDAKTLVTVLPSDAANVFIALTSRGLKQQLQIIARGELPSTRKKLVQAGADRVVLPAAIGAQRMAAMITRPSMVELMELVTASSVVDVAMDELRIPHTSTLINRTVQQIEARRRHGLLVVAVKRSTGDMLFSPDENYSFQADDTVIVMGRPEDIDRFRGEYGL